MPERCKAAEALRRALEAILAARVALVGPGTSLKPPTGALDAALAADEGVKKAQKQLSVDMAAGDLLGVEAAANPLCANGQ